MQIWYHIVQCDLQSHGRYEIFISSKDRVEQNTFPIDSINPISWHIDNNNFITLTVQVSMVMEAVDLLRFTYFIFLIA